jgi:hypothetical protein
MEAMAATNRNKDGEPIPVDPFEVVDELLLAWWFEQKRKRRHQEMLDRYRDQLSADFKAGMS